MKKIKLLITVFLLLFSFVMLSTINAEEVTTEEEVTEETTTEELVEEELTLPPLDDKLFSDAKDWITAGIAAIVSWLFSGGIAYLLLKRYERRALKAVEKVVDLNELSQKQAELSIVTIEKVVNTIESKLSSFESGIDNKVKLISEQSTSISEKMDKINAVINDFGKAVETFLIEDEEV